MEIRVQWGVEQQWRCCAAGLACEDNFEDLCTGTSTDLGDFNAGMMFALLAGISTLGLCCIFYFSVIKKRS